MRVIAGLYRGRTLKSPADTRTRPTSDRLRETVFNIIGPRIDASVRFLDLCAGTGAVGIEALSRGAGFATFIDRSRKACALIEDNLEHLRIPEDSTEIVCVAAETYVGRNFEEGWDIVYFDPPYDLEYLTVLLEFGSADSTLLNDGGLMIAEHHSKAKMPETVGELRRWRVLKQGDSSLSFYEKA